MFETLVIIFYYAILIFPIVGIIIGFKYFNPFEEEKTAAAALPAERTEEDPDD